MKHRLGAVLAGALVASLVVFAPVSTAASNTLDACAGQGTAVTGPLYYPQVLTPSWVGFTFTFYPGSGACVMKTTLTAGGTITGWCGHSVGRGQTNSNHHFAWVSAGGVLVLTGGVVGTAAVFPDAFTGESCLVGATRFVVTGAGMKTSSCSGSDKTKIVVATILNMTYSVKVCSDI